MEMRSVSAIPREPGWQYEPKWDGFRCLTSRDGDDVVMDSKAGQPLTRYFPEVAAALAAVDGERFTLDGELVVPLAGALSFDALQQRIHPAASRVAMLARTTPALYLVFDVLDDGIRSLREAPLHQRRAVLEQFARRFEPGGALRLSPATTSPAVVDEWFARVGGALDGVIAKRLDAPYHSGRTDAAVKVKKQRTADCVVGGFRYAANARDRVGSLLLGLYDAEGLLDYIGFCSAFSAPERVSLLARLRPLMGRGGFSGGAPETAPSRWDRGRERDKSYERLAPELVLEVGFDQVTSGRIRHGTRPLRWRTDKPPEACTSEQLEVAGSVAALLDP
ncbi:MAG: ATP-dependent DNA ligase [Candidatus Eremiobacteraeota bacterium]|nr:ATP-dependent DNA ligase [Candidatus Eremiobacteraeota bacterium]